MTTETKITVLIEKLNKRRITESEFYTKYVSLMWRNVQEKEKNYIPPDKETVIQELISKKLYRRFYLNQKQKKILAKKLKIKKIYKKEPLGSRIPWSKYKKETMNTNWFLTIFNASCFSDGTRDIMLETTGQRLGSLTDETLDKLNIFQKERKTI